MAFVEDRTPFFADFGIDATVGAGTVRGIFDNAYQDAFSLVPGTAPVFMCASADVSSVDVGDSITINATAYSVTEVRPDGTGMTVLVLQR